MDSIILENISKRFQHEWIFKNVSLQFSSNSSYVILGANGSGKSTLLHCISGLLSHSKGKIQYFRQGKTIPPENVFEYVSIATPYQELIEEFTLTQMIDFHKNFKLLRNNYNTQQMIEILNMTNQKDKLIRNFSSGMKQRVKLALAILSDSNLLLLDEPTSNLDQKNKEWYHQLIENHLNNRIVIVCSNHQKDEYFFCKEKIEIERYK